MIKKLHVHYSKIPIGVKASLWFAICSVLQKGIQFITMPLFTRLLTVEQYGQYSLYLSWLGVINIFATLNLSAGVFNNGMLKYKNSRPKFIASIQGLSTVSTLCVMFFFFMFGDLCESFLNLPEILIVPMFVEILFTPAFLYWSMRQRYEFKYRNVVIVTLLMSLVNPLLGFFAICKTTEKGIARILSVIILNSCVGIVFYIYNLKKGKTFYDSRIWRFALKFNIPLIPHYLSSVILGQADRIMIEKMFGESEVAMYSVAYSISMVISIIVGSVNASFIPWTYQKCSQQKYMEVGHISNILIVTIGTVCLIPIFTAPEIMRIMAPKSYSDAIWAMPPVALSVYFIFLYSLFGNIEFYFEETKFIMIASVISAVSNIVLNLIFMPVFGYIAAGYTTLACYIIYAFAHFCFMRKTCQNKIKDIKIYEEKKILLISFILFLECAIAMILYRMPLFRYGILGVAGMILFLLKEKIVNFYKMIKTK